MKITEDCVSFEVEKLLEEKGFDKSYCTGYAKKSNSDGTCELIRVCTLQMACKWLREEKNIWCEITWGGKNSWCSEVFDLKNEEYVSDSIHHKINSYEEAVEAAIKYTLENLI